MDAKSRKMHLKHSGRTQARKNKRRQMTDIGIYKPLYFFGFSVGEIRKLLENLEQRSDVI